MNHAPVREDRDYVLYWMTSARRTTASWSLAHAVGWAGALNKPLVVFEPLRCGYRWASDRHHRFIIEGMVDNGAAFEKAGVTYLPYVEPDPRPPRRRRAAGAVHLRRAGARRDRRRSVERRPTSAARRRPHHQLPPYVVGKKVLAWSKTPQEALERLIELNNKWAIDGRDPNSLSGIFWCFGRFDRAWGPERPIYGKVRDMTSDSARRKLKLKLKHYLDRWTDDEEREQLTLLAS